MAAFLAGAFLAAALVAVFLAAVRLAGPAVTPRLTAGPSAGRRCAPETTALNCAPGRNAGTEVGLTFTVSPVRGLRATRAARRRCSKTPKPVIVTLSPLCTARTMVSTTFSTAAVACRRSVPSLVVSTSMSSALFIQNLRNQWSTLNRLEDTVNPVTTDFQEPRAISGVASELSGNLVAPLGLLSGGSRTGSVGGEFGSPRPPNQGVRVRGFQLGLRVS